jgi:hypothetical protein
VGEYADMAIDQALNWDDGTYGGDWDDERQYFYSSRSYRTRTYKKQPKTCRNCGQENLYWLNTNRGWRLYAYGAVEHICSGIGFKQALANLRVDSQPKDDYNAYLDTVPWPTESPYESEHNRAST